MISRSRGESCGTCAVARGESRMRSSRGSTYEPPPATRSIAAMQLVHRAGLQRVAARAGVQAVVEQLGVGVARVEDHAELGAPGQQLAREVDAAAVGELDVDDRDVGLGVLDQVDARGDVARRAHDLEPSVLQQRDQALAQGLVVVDDHELRHGRRTVHGASER